MKVAVRGLLMAALSTLMVQAAAAQTVWRCDAQGRVSYADTPCPGGQALAEADRGRAPAPASAAEVLARDRALAERLRDERLALLRERHEQGTMAAQAGSLGGAKALPPPGAATKMSKTPKKPKKAKAPPHGLQPAAAGTSPSALLSIRPRSG